jgi:hypothetical protein
MNLKVNQLNIVEEISMIEYIPKGKENEIKHTNSEKNTENNNALNWLEWGSSSDETENVE